MAGALAEHLTLTLTLTLTRTRTLTLTQVQWRSTSPMGFVAAVDACAAESDSLLRWSGLGLGL